jgi:DNA repair exonuclease SbcCD ATPase subunit
MKIEQMQFKNFRCFEDKEIDFSETTGIYGTNGLGKTTIVDGFFWCFFGKSSDGRSTMDFPKPVIDNEQIMDIETEVSTIVDGVTYTRQLIEGWRRPKGQTERVFGGYTQKMFIDGVKKTKTEFNKTIAETIGKEEEFRLLTSPHFVPNMKWSDMRSLLIGDNDALKDQSTALETFKLDHKKLDSEVKALPIEIKAIQAMSPNSETPFDQEEYDSLNSQREDLMSEVIKLENPAADEELNKLKSEKLDTELKLSQEKRRFDTERQKMITEQTQQITNIVESRRAGLNQAYNEYQENFGMVSDQLSGKKLALKSAKQKATVLKTKTLPELRNTYLAIMATTCDADDYCPTCSQEMPSEHTEQATKNFNLQKSESIKENNANGMAKSKELDALKTSIIDLELEVSQLEDQLTEVKKTQPMQENEKSPEEVQILLDIETLRKQPYPVGITTIEEALSRINIKIEKYDTENTVDHSERIAEVRDGIRGINETMALMDQDRAADHTRNESKEKVKTLKKDLSAKSGKLAELECNIDKATATINAIIKKEEEELNKRFSFTTFKLFTTLQNGEVKPTCVPTVDGIPYTDLNRAKQLNCGIDIANSLMKERGVNYPIFIDNAECSNTIEKPIGQSIKLYVTTDNKLTIKEL